jgi:SAM-dependent methyltransferase
MGGLPLELRGRWNHNTHYYPLALAETPCRRAIDVGCGDGLLLRLLAPRCEAVVGIDPWTDPTVLADVGNATVLAADFLATPLEPEGYDLVCSFATIHHMEFEPALRKMAALVAPGGKLIVVGLAAYTPATWLISGLTIPAHHLMVWRRGYWEHPAPIAEPQLTWPQVRRTVKRVLPGARFRRRLYWRYSITWTRPPDG